MLCKFLARLQVLSDSRKKAYLEVDYDDEGGVGGHPIREEAVCGAIPAGLAQGKQGHKEADNAMPQTLKQPPATLALQ